MRNLAVLLVAALALAACQGTTGSTTRGPDTVAAAADYVEVRHDGRVYVVGSAAAVTKYGAGTDSIHLPYTRSRVGFGPAGETVVFELDKTDPTLVERLEATFREKHLFYQEFRHDGRFYVTGSPDTAAAFAKAPHLPYTRTFIGAGPGGKTVVLEVDKKNPHLAWRLRDEFESHHRVTLD